MKNKYQEALHYFESYIGVTDNPVTNQLVEEYVDILNELIGKETPMKLLKSQIDGYRECGNCNSIIVSTNHVVPKYCSECGQKIDWGDND